MYAFAIAVALMLLAGCSSPERLVFANREWHISTYYGQIIDKDTTYRMTFGDVLIPDPLTIVSSADSVAKYPGMDRWLGNILHTCHLDSAEILFYAPHMATMFVRPNGDVPHIRPSSITSPMADERPYTMWIYKDDMEDWARKPSEMYTYTYFNKGKQQLLVVNHYDYGDSPIAQITIFQSRNKTTDKMNVPNAWKYAFYLHDFKKIENIEFWSHGIESVRKHAIANYKIGQEQKIRNK